MTFERSFIALLFSFSLAGCASDSAEDVAAPQNRTTDLEKRYAESSGFKTDTDGNLISSKSNKRSSFERNRESSFFKGKIEKEVYQTGDFEKKSWWGSKTYKVDEYKGDTDGSRFKSAAKSYGKGELYADQKVDTGKPYNAEILDYESARESDGKRIEKPRNDYTESRKRSYLQPSVIDWKEQRKLSMEQSRGILGR